MKKVLITAGQVYGILDDNKVVGNRIRGIWATRFAQFLAERGHEVTLFVPDINTPKYEPHPRVTVVQFRGYDDYAEKCYAAAMPHDAALCAAAVVNWIPKNPIKGKMKTAGFAEGATQHIEFYLAPRVIDRMRKLNPKLTLIGCKMTSGSPPEETFQAAYETLIKGHCNVVVANDLSDLKQKTLVYPDGHLDPVLSFDRMYRDLELVIEDQHYRTEREPPDYVDASATQLRTACNLFDRIVEQYRDRFVKRPGGVDRVFGAIAVRMGNGAFLVSPREKGTQFTSKDAVVVAGFNTTFSGEDHVVRTVRGRKATLNAPLLVRMLNANPDDPAVVHLHEQLPNEPTLPYAPPGTTRDNDRPIPGRRFNIEGHGCIFIWN